MADTPNGDTRPPKRISKRQVDALKPGDPILWDGTVKGFGVRCQRAAKVYILKKRVRGKQRWFSIGEHGNPWTVKTASDEAKRLQGLIADNKDPAKEREDAKNPPTVKELCQRFLDDYARDNKKQSSADADERNIENHVLPILGKEFVIDVTHADIEKFKRAVKNGKTARKSEAEGQCGVSVKGGEIAANRCLSLLSKMFNLAELWGLRQSNSNPVRHIAKYSERKREQFLSEADLAVIAETLNEENETGEEYVVAAIRLLLFTGARLREVLSLKWENVDLEKALLNLPDSKTGEKSIYLSAPALNILANLPKIKGNPFVICGAKEKASLVNLQKPWSRIRDKATLKMWESDNDMAPLISKSTKDNKLPSIKDLVEQATAQEIPIPKGLTNVRLHDLRHSFASIGAGGGLSLPMIGKLLGHTQAATTARYAHLADDPIRAANEAIGEKIAAAMKGKSGEVVEMPKRKA